jgi:hypothetical protein
MAHDRPLWLASLFLASLSLAQAPSQQTTTYGNPVAFASLTNAGVGTLFEIHSTMSLDDFALWVRPVSAQATLQFVCYRSTPLSGTYTLDWTVSVPLPAPSSTASWVPMGPAPKLLLAGSSYLLGATCSGSVDYYYSALTGSIPSNTNTLWGSLRPIAAGAATVQVPTSTNGGEFRQQLTTTELFPSPVSVLPCLCGGFTPPRLAITQALTIGGTGILEVSGPNSGNFVGYGLALGWLPSGFPSVGGCTGYIQANHSVFRSANYAGLSSVALPVPNDVWLIGLNVGIQCVVINYQITLTNALGCIVGP